MGGIALIARPSFLGFGSVAQMSDIYELGVVRAPHCSDTTMPSHLHVFQTGNTVLQK